MLIKLIPIIIFVIFLAGCGKSKSKDLILESCQDMIRKDVSVHPRLINIEQHSKYKFTFDVVFIEKGKEVEWLKGGHFDKNYACEYFPEEGSVYKGLSEKQIAEDERVRKLKEKERATRKAKEKAIREAKEKVIREAKQKKEYDRKVKAIKTARIKREKKIKAEKKRIAERKSKGAQYYGELCHGSMDRYFKKLYQLRHSEFKNNYNDVRVFFTAGAINGQGYEKTCKIAFLLCDEKDRRTQWDRCWMPGSVRQLSDKKFDETINRAMNPWIGKSETKLVQHWGARYGTDTTDSGEKIVTYEERFRQPEDRTRRTTFTLKNGKVVSWRIRNDRNP